MKVRRAAPDDAVGIAETLRAIAEEPEDWILTEPPVDVSARAERIREHIAQPGNASFVLVDDAGRTVGSLGLVVAGDGALQLGMGVVREARGGGHGGALLDAALDFAAAAGRTVVLEVYASNERAIALYERRGFAVTAELPQRFERADGSRRDSLRMEWSPPAP